jgi:hypothetical protein
MFSDILCEPYNHQIPFYQHTQIGKKDRQAGITEFKVPVNISRLAEIIYIKF